MCHHQWREVAYRDLDDNEKTQLGRRFGEQRLLDSMTVYRCTECGGLDAADHSSERREREDDESDDYR